MPRRYEWAPRLRITINEKVYSGEEAFHIEVLRDGGGAPSSSRRLSEGRRKRVIDELEDGFLVGRHAANDRVRHFDGRRDPGICGRASSKQDRYDRRLGMFTGA